MGYAHGTPIDAEVRICTCCKKEKPNTLDYYGYASKKTGRLSAVCKECRSVLSKQNNHKSRQRFDGIDPNHIVYDGTKMCIKCNRDLPNSYLYFPADKTCKTGLRNVCRECSPSFSGFLPEGYKVPPKWTKEEIQCFKENYAHYTCKELQSKFFPNRSVRAIDTMADVLGIAYKTPEALKRGRKIAAKATSIALKGRTYSEETLRKMSQGRKEYYKTHESHWKGRVVSEEEKQRARERNKGKWAGDKNPRHINPLGGKLNGRWRGGILSLHNEYRTRIDYWKQDSMAFCNYKCVITGGGFDNIHHTSSYTDILTEALNNLGFKPKKKIGDYTSDELNRLDVEVEKLHKIYGFGACINKDVHKLFHDIYAYTKFTPDDFLEFLRDIDNGKYKDWFISHNLTVNINYEYLSYLEELCDILKDDVI